MIKYGDIAFFKRAKRSIDPKSNEIEFKGHGFGVFLGAIPHFAKEPTEQDVLTLMGMCGFISFDDIGRYMGAEMLLELMKKIEEKNKLIEEPTTAPALILAPPTEN